MPKYTSVQDMPPTFKEILALFEALRRLGFTPDEIKFWWDPDKKAGVAIDAQGKALKFVAGEADFKTREEFMAAWEDTSTQAMEIYAQQPTESRDLFFSSKVMQNGFGFVSEILRHGFKIKDERAARHLSAED